MVYAIKYQGRYIRFGSYSEATLVDHPENATLYVRPADIKYRLEPGKRYYLTHPVRRPRKRIEAEDLEAVEIHFTFTESPTSVSKG